MHHSTFDYYSQFNNELSFWKSIETRYNFVHFTRIYEFAVTVWTIFLVTIKNLVKMLRLQFIVQFVNINGIRCSLMFVCIYCFCRPLKFICTVVVINTFLYSVIVPFWISVKISMSFWPLIASISVLWEFTKMFDTFFTARVWWIIICIFVSRTYGKMSLC